MATKKPFGWNTVVGALMHMNTVNEKTVQGIAAAQAMLSMNNNNRSTFTITPVPSPNASKSKQSQNTRTILEFHTVLFLISVVLQAISSLFTDYMMDWDETANVCANYVNISCISSITNLFTLCCMVEEFKLLSGIETLLFVPHCT